MVAVSTAEAGSIRHPSLGITAYDLLRDRIIQLRIAPGTRLLIDEISREFGVSRTPIRDALRLLVGDGLVTMGAHGAFFVRSADPSFVRDLFEVRLPLECLAVRRATPRVQMDDLLAVRRLIEVVRDADASPDASERFYESDDRFHGLILGESNNEVLQATLRLLNNQIRWLRHLTYRHRPADHIATCNEHLAIIAAFVQRDADLAVERMAEHLGSAQQRLSTPE